MVKPVDDGDWSPRGTGGATPMLMFCIDGYSGLLIDVVISLGPKPPKAY